MDIYRYVHKTFFKGQKYRVCPKSKLNNLYIYIYIADKGTRNKYISSTSEHWHQRFSQALNAFCKASIGISFKHLVVACLAASKVPK